MADTASEEEGEEVNSGDDDGDGGEGEAEECVRRTSEVDSKV